MPSFGPFHRGAFVCLVYLSVYGCSVSPSGTSRRPVPATFVRATLTSRSSSADVPGPPSSVPSFPLYQQAEQACQRKNYAQAVRLLQRLAVAPGLSAAQRRFVLEQRNLCLHDAGLPAPTLALAAPPAVSPEPNPSRSAADADCGPRALLLLSNQLGIPASLPQLRRLAGTTGNGTSLDGLARAAQSLGLKTEGVQVSREALPDLPMPGIAWTNGRHYCAVLALQGRGEQGTAVIHDPNQPQEETISQERLLRLSGGILLLVHK